MDTLGVSFNDLFSLCLIVSLIVYVIAMVKVMRSPKVKSVTNDAPDSPVEEKRTRSTSPPPKGESNVKGREKSADPFEMVNPKWKRVFPNPKVEEKEESKDGKSD